MKKRFPYLPIMICLFGFVTICCKKAETIPPSPTMVYFVRHAEKDLSDTTDNPNLSEIGKQRAAKLKSVLSPFEFTSIFSTDYTRTLNTVGPLAESQGVKVQLYAAYDWENMLNKVKQGQGKNHLICGHSHNIVPMIDFLGGEAPFSELGHAEYDKLFAVEILNDQIKVNMTTY